MRCRLAVRVDRRELGVLGQQAELLLPLQDAGADGLVALVELALVLVGPLLGHVVRRVPAPGDEVHEERLVGIDDLGVDWMIPIAWSARSFDEVVALLGRRRRLDLVVVVDEVRDTTGSISPPRNP